MAALILLVFIADALSQSSAPGGPGKDAYWWPAGKQAIGTPVSLNSKVWFTLAQGVMTEVYYPNVTVANVQTLQFVVVGPKTKGECAGRADTSPGISGREAALPETEIYFDVW